MIIQQHHIRLLESIPEALVIADRDGSVVLANSEAGRVFGCSREELIGKHVEMLIPLLFQNPDLDPAVNGRAFQTADSAVRVALHKDGREFPTEISPSFLWTTKGVFTLHICRDSAELKLVADKTAMHLQRENIVSSILRATLESASVKELLEFVLDQILAIPSIALESQGAIFLMEGNPPSLTMKTHRGLPATVVAACGHVPIGTCLCGIAAKTLQPVFASELDESHSVRYPGILPHGHYCIPVVSEGTLHGVINLYLKEGHLFKAEEQVFLCSVADALAGAIMRKEMEHSLRVSEERFALAVRGTDAGIWDWDLQSNEVYFSPRWKNMLGLQENEISGQHIEWEKRLHPEDREHALATLSCYLDGKSADYELEHRLLHKDGSYRWILARGAALRDLNGVPYRMVGSHLDITKSKLAEETLMRNTARLVAVQRIQEHLLPRHAPDFSGFDIAGFLHPAEFAAGDCYDYIPMQGGSLGVVIGDVSGHGIDSALLMASTHAYLRSLAEVHDRADEILRRANALLKREFEPNRFVSILFGCLEPGSGVFTYVNAGHQPGYIFNSACELKSQLDPTAFALGMFADPPFQISDPIVLEPGDIILLLTDGILEQESPDGAQFGRERTFEAIRSAASRPAVDILAALHAAICTFAQRKTFTDDITAVVIKVDL